MGPRNFGNNSATNLRVLAWLTGGESLHNNHHAYPSSPKFSMGRFEFDPSWVVIRVLAAVRLVEIVGTPVEFDEKDDAAQRRATTKEASTR